MLVQMWMLQMIVVEPCSRNASALTIFIKIVCNFFSHVVQSSTIAITTIGPHSRMLACLNQLPRRFSLPMVPPAISLTILVALRLPLPAGAVNTTLLTGSRKRVHGHRFIILNLSHAIICAHYCGMVPARSLDPNPRCPRRLT